jgi:hypothetical protein
MRGSIAVSWLVAEEPDDRFQKLDGVVCSRAGWCASDASPADVEGVLEGCGVVISGAEEMERDRAYVMGSGIGGEVGAAVEDRFSAFHDAPSSSEAIGCGLRCGVSRRELTARQSGCAGSGSGLVPRTKCPQVGIRLIRAGERVSMSMGGPCPHEAVQAVAHDDDDREDEESFHVRSLLCPAVVTARKNRHHRGA